MRCEFLDVDYLRRLCSGSPCHKSRPLILPFSASSAGFGIDHSLMPGIGGDVQACGFRTNIKAMTWIV